MEYMRIEGFLGYAISKLVNKAVEQKVGFRPNLELKGLKLYTDDDNNYVQADLSVRLSKEDFDRLIEEATK